MHALSSCATASKWPSARTALVLQQHASATLTNLRMYIKPNTQMITIKNRNGDVILEYDGANLRGADLYRASLYGANLYGAKNVPYIPLACPSDGAFVAWKKVNDKLVKLLIPEDAKRLSATTRKCRCDKAHVLAITDLDGGNPVDEVLNTSKKQNLLYKVGEMVYPDSFDENRWNECSHGIHFFINKQDAIDY